MSNHAKVSRRSFVKGAVAAGAAIGALPIVGALAKAQSKSVKVGLIGCGGRGGGAAGQRRGRQDARR